MVLSIFLNANKTKIYFKPQLFNSRDRLFHKKRYKWLKLFLNSVRMLLNIIFSFLEILVYFRSCNLENQPVFSPPIYRQLHSKFGLLALFCISMKRLELIFLKSPHKIFMMYIIRSETFIEIDSLQHLKISRPTYPTNLLKICVKTFTVLTLC